MCTDKLAESLDKMRKVHLIANQVVVCTKITFLPCCIGFLRVVSLFRSRLSH
jgi:hypothetical protein